MAIQKTYSKSDQIGESGQKLAALTITRLGHIWHDRRIDHGVDGQIELVDPINRAATNVQVLVQSKATEGRFAGENASTFHYLLSAADIAYWRNGDNKVIVVCSRPSDDAIWWAPLERAEPPDSKRKTWRIDFDKVSDALDAESASRLLLWASDAKPGRAVSGREHRAETLETNLVRLVRLPPHIYFGPTWKPTPKQLGPALRDRGYYRSDWIIRSGVVYTFTRPQQDGLGAFLDGGYETIETMEWAESKDMDTLGHFADLLRQTLGDQEHEKLWFHPKKRYFLFRAPRVTTDHLKIKVSRSKPGRTVYQRYFKDGPGSETKDCRHYAAQVRFVRTDEGWAAEINPTYHFTFDGKRDLPWGEDRAKGMKKIEKNPAVRGTVKFWADYLSRAAALGEPERQLEFDNLITVEVDIGINDNAWRPAPPDTTIDLTEPVQQELLT